MDTIFTDADFEKPEIDVSVFDEANWFKPEIKTNQIYDADRDLTVNIPDTFDENDTRFAIGTQIDNKDKTEYVAKTPVGDTNFFEDIGKVTEDIYKGAIAGLVDLPTTITAGTLKRVSEDASLAILTSAVTMPATMIEAIKTLDSSKKQKEPSRINRDLFELSNKILDKKKDFLNKAKLEPTSFAGKVGQGVSSMAIAIGATLVTKNPMTAAALFGVNAQASSYIEATENNLSPAKARQISTMVGAGEAGLEAVGIGALFKIFKYSKPLQRRFTRIAAKTMMGATTEATQEALQTGSEELIMQSLGGREKSKYETTRAIAESALIGAILGGGVTGAVESAKKAVPKPEDITETEYNEIAENTVAEVYEEKTDLIPAVFDVLAKELDTDVEPHTPEQFASIVKKADTEQRQKVLDTLIEKGYKPEEVESVLDNAIEEMTKKPEGLLTFEETTEQVTAYQEERERIKQQVVKTGFAEQDAEAFVSTIDARVLALSDTLKIPREEVVKQWGLEIQEEISPEAELERAIPLLKQRERAAILEFDEGLTREEAERKAYAEEFITEEPLELKAEISDNDVLNMIEADTFHDYMVNIGEVKADSILKRYGVDKDFGSLGDRIDVLSTEVTGGKDLLSVAGKKKIKLPKKTKETETLFQDPATYDVKNVFNVDDIVFVNQDEGFQGTIKRISSKGNIQIEKLDGSVFWINANKIDLLSKTGEIKTEIRGGIEVLTEKFVKEKTGLKFIPMSARNNLGFNSVKEAMFVINNKEELKKWLELLEQTGKKASHKRRLFKKRIAKNFEPETEEEKQLKQAKIEQEQEKQRLKKIETEKLIYKKTLGKYWEDALILDKEEFEYDVKKDSYTLQDEIYNKLLLEKEQERYDYEIENIEEVLEEQGDDLEEITKEYNEDNKTNLTIKEWLETEDAKNYIPTPEQEIENRQEYDSSLEREVYHTESGLRQDFLDDRLNLFRKIIEDSGYTFFYETSRVSDSTYINISNKEETESVSIRFSDHIDRYGSEYHIWFDESALDNVKTIIDIMNDNGLPIEIKDDTVKISNLEIAEFKQDKKGAIRFEDGKTIISLFETADASTLLHELGHLYLRDMEHYAKTTKNLSIQGDMGAVRKWLKADKDTPLTATQHEQFVRGFEQYLRTGKAPVKRLQGLFNQFKEWLQSIYKSATELNVKLTPEIKNIFDNIFMTVQERIEANSIEVPAEDYASVILYQNKKTTAKEILKNKGLVVKDTDNLATKIFVPISTRLDKVNSKLKHIMRRFEFTTNIRKMEDTKKIKSFLEKVSDMDKDDYFILDFAFKNRDTKQIDYYAKKYEMEKEIADVRNILEDIRQRALDAGLDVNVIENYFPRDVINSNEYISYLKGTTYWSHVEKELIRSGYGNATDEVKAYFINNKLAEYDFKEFQEALFDTTEHTLARKIKQITPEMNVFYNDSIQALLKYISGMNSIIEAKKFWGLDTENLEDSIGSVVGQMMEDKTLDVSQEEELKKILRARFNMLSPRGIVKTYKNLSYIYTMGNPLSALTQIGDLAFSFYKNGYYNTGSVLFRKKQITKEDIGIEHIAQEFIDEDTSAKAVNTIFKAVGLTWIDKLGKETTINSSLKKLQKQAKTENKELKEYLDMIFGEEDKQVLQDLKNDVDSENVKYLLFSELSDLQPISLVEMPEQYLTGGNSRIFYMLKTYTIKLFDVYNNEIFRKMDKHPKEAMTNLVKLSFALILCNATADELKNLLLGREIDLSDMVIDNILRLIGFSKWQIYKSRREGLGATALQSILPPVPFFDDLYKDVSNFMFAKKKKKLKDLRLYKGIPLFGKLYYWWFGAGVKLKKKGR